MHYFLGARKFVRLLALVRATAEACPRVARFAAPMLCFLAVSFPIHAQDAGSAERDSFGKGSEITVIVHDASGQPISAPAIVKLLRDGSIPSGQSQTSRGSAEFVVNTLGEFTVTVQAAGYANAQKEISVRVAGRTQLEIYLQRLSTNANAPTVPGRPLLAPKAKDAAEKTLQAINANKLVEAEKHVDEALRLAPSHPDVLYVQGILRLKQHNWLQAQSAFEKATQLDPNHAPAFAALGMALCDQGKFEAAIAPLEKSLQLDAAGTWEARWTLAKAYYHQARYDDALKMSQVALAASGGKAPEINLLVAQSLSATGHYEDAAQTLRDFLHSHSDSHEADTARKWLQGLTSTGRARPYESSPSNQ